MPSESLKDITWIVVDLETTGLKPWEGDKICEIAALRVKNEKIIDEFQSLVNPERHIPPDAQAIHGISNEQVKNAPAIEHLLQKFRQFSEKGIIAGYNIEFDLEFINSELKTIGETRIFIKDSLDVWGLARRLLHLPHYKLSDVAQALHIAPPEHRALSECKATWQVLKRLLEMSNSATSDELRTTIRSENPYKNLIDTIGNTIKNKQQFHLRYQASNQESTDRTITPIDYGDQHLVAYCHLRKAERNFRFDRIKSLQAT